MPIYQYRHTEGHGPQCEADIEVFQNMADDKFEVCPDCGKPLIKLITKPALVRVEQEGTYQSVDHGGVRLPANRAAAKAKIKDHIRKHEGEEKADAAEILSPNEI